MRRWRAVLGRCILAASVGLLAACGPGGTPGANQQPAGSSSVTGTITVLAAASLTESFTALGEQFEAAHPGTTVTFSFGPSSGLAEQVNQGAPADVFASASTTTMDEVTAAGNARSPVDFASNVMQIAVPVDNPAKIDTLADLTRGDVKVALCQPLVPCGTVAAKVFEKAGLTVTPVSLEADVKSVLAKVSLDEVDAGIVYVTDVRAAGGRVAGIKIPDDVNASTAYPISVLKASSNRATAQAFVDYVLSDVGQSVLARAGFSRP